MEIIEVKVSDLPEIERLARKVWEPTYRHIVPQEQIVFMEERMHRVAAYLQQMEEGHLFCMAKMNDKVVGFLTIVVQEEGLKISKLYVDTDFHHSGIGKALLQFSKQLCIHKKMKYIELNVNRYNKALYFYRRNDFYILHSVDIPYYGFYLNDYVVRWDAPQY